MLCDKAKIILGNLIWNLSHDTCKQELQELLSAPGDTRKITRALGKLTGMSEHTLRKLAQTFVKNEWKFTAKQK